MPSLFRLLSLALLLGVTTATNVLLPLYIFPSDTAWKPIYDAATAHLNLKFETVINPASGKPDPAPDAAYAQGVRNLRTHSNIEVIGYIATGLDASTGEDRRLTATNYIANYSTWPAESRPSGIFLDEVTRTTSADVAEYQRIVSFARSKGFTGTIILNCGGIPTDAAMFGVGDQLVAFEGFYDNPANTGASWVGAREQQVASLGNDRPDVSIIVHTMPDDNSILQQLVTTAKERKYGSVFLTDNAYTDAHPNPFDKFGGDWNDFVNAMAA